MGGFFQTQLTKRIDDIIRRDLPDFDNPLSPDKVGKELGYATDYTNLKPIRSYLNELVRKQRLSTYGSDDAMSVIPKVYFIKEEHEKLYWTKKD